MFTVMSYGGLALAVVCLVVVVILFIKWDIPKVLGEITGSTQKKAIEKIQKEGYEPNASKSSSIKTNADSGAIRVRKTNTDELIGGHTGKTAELPEEEMTQSTDSARREGLTVQENVTNTVFHVYQPGEEATTVLNSEAGTDAEEATTVLSSEAGTDAEEETTVLSSETGTNAEEETTVLSSQTDAEEETTVLSSKSEEEEETTVLSSEMETGTESEEQTTVLNSETDMEPEEQTTVLSATSVEEQTTVLQNIVSKGEEEMHPSEESTTILATGSVDEVIHIPNEIYTQPGTVMKVLDFMITHTDEVIA